MRSAHLCAMLSQGKDREGGPRNIHPELKYRGRNETRPKETEVQMSVNKPLREQIPALFENSDILV